MCLSPVFSGAPPIQLDPTEGIWIGGFVLSPSSSTAPYPEVWLRQALRVGGLVYSLPFALVFIFVGRGAFLEDIRGA